METDLFKLVVAQLPNFIGLLVCVGVLWKQNRDLLQLLRECLTSKGGEEMAEDDT